MNSYDCSVFLCLVNIVAWSCCITSMLCYFSLRDVKLWNKQSILLRLVLVWIVYHWCSVFACWYFWLGEYSSKENSNTERNSEKRLTKCFPWYFVIDCSICIYMNCLFSQTYMLMYSAHNLYIFCLVICSYLDVYITVNISDYTLFKSKWECIHTKIRVFNYECNKSSIQ